MKIGIDARFYGALGKGLGRYTSELLKQLERLDQENEYVVFLRKANWDEYVPSNPRFRKVLAEYQWYTWREQILFPRLIRSFNLDLVHFPHFNVPLLYRRPFVVTIHDLILLSHPTPRATRLGPLVYRLKYLAYRLVIASAVARATQVITVSDYTRQEIIRTFPAAKNKKITVTHEACATTFIEDDEIHEGRVMHLPTPFMLYVGNAYPHKNLERLIRAFQSFRENNHADYHLVLVGATDYFYERLKKEAAMTGADTNVTFFGHASDAELRGIYARAEYYVFPSLCEGFGLPPLEAMCARLPVAASDATCLPEILGDAVLYFNPEDESAIADALARMADDTGLRNTLRDKGTERAGKFDWTSCAKKTIDVYLNTLVSPKDLP